MSGITNNISKMLSMTTSSTTIYVADNSDLLEDIRRGWPNRDVRAADSASLEDSDKYLLISSENMFTIKF